MPTLITKPQAVRFTAQTENVPPVVVGLGEGALGISNPKARAEALHVDDGNIQVACVIDSTAHTDEAKHRLIQRTRRERMRFIHLQRVRVEVVCSIEPWAHVRPVCVQRRPKEIPINSVILKVLVDAQVVL